MQRRVVIAVLLVALATVSHGFMRKTYTPDKVNNHRFHPKRVGDPLFLTPLIESGQLEKARQLSRVGPLQGLSPDLESYSGYFTVNKTTQSNMFFWFFPAQVDPENAPVVLWLQGGPGGTSLFGLFVENGPIYVTKDGNAQPRNITWNKNFNMIYIDNPVGTGFSFTKQNAGYAQDENDVARDLYSALTQFFTLFDSYQKNEFYVTGESYAGKYVPAITYKIYKEGKDSIINLKGMAIGDGLCDPVTMIDYADYLYQIGLIDDIAANHFRSEQQKAVTYIKNKQFYEAFLVFDALLNGDKLNGSKAYFANVTGLNFYYNFLLTNEPPEFDYYGDFVTTANSRLALHVGDLPFNDGSVVEDYLENDMMQSVKPWIAEIMNAGYKVMIYNGQLDIIIAYPLTSSFVSSIPWNGANAFNGIGRKIWTLPGSTAPAGYVRQVNNFTEVLVRNAGHILPYDQPEAGFDMINRFIFNKPFA